MRLNGLAAVAALLLVTVPAAAAAPPAAPRLHEAAHRVGADIGDASRLEGTTAWILAAIGLGLIVWGIIELTSDDDAPTSP